MRERPSLGRPTVSKQTVGRALRRVEQELAEARRIEGIVATLGYLYGKPCFAGAIGGIVDGRPSTHVVLNRSLPVQVCRYHAAAATRIGEGAWRLPRP